MRLVLMAGIAAVLCLSTAFAQATRAPAAGKAKTSAAPFDPHDLNGVWYRVSPIQTFSNVYNVQPNLPPNLAGARGRGTVFEEAPFTPAGKAALEKNKPGYGPRVVPPAFGNDPMGTCDPLGIPRNLNAEVGSSHTTWWILQTKDLFIQFFQWHHDHRIVWTDGRSLPKTDDLDPKWNGYSVGHWDGNTFVVDSIGFDARTWLDKFGYPHTENMKLQERYRRLDHDTLELTMTLTDPGILLAALGKRPQDFQAERFADQGVSGGRAVCEELGPAGLLRAVGRVQVQREGSRQRRGEVQHTIGEIRAWLQMTDAAYRDGKY